MKNLIMLFMIKLNFFYHCIDLLSELDHREFRRTTHVPKCKIDFKMSTKSTYPFQLLIEGIAVIISFFLFKIVPQVQFLIY